MSWVYLNGRFLHEDEAFIPIHDRGFLFGDGVFTTIKVDKGEIEHLDLHLERLNAHCQALQIIPPTLSQEVFDQLIEKNQAGDGLWRMKVVITGGSEAQLNLKQRDYGTCLVTLSSYTPPKEPLKLCLYPNPIQTPDANLKTLSYLNRLMVKQYALEKGFDDAIVLSPEGFLLETAFSNLLWKVEEEWFTPDISLPLLPGTYLSTLPQVHHVRVTLNALPNNAELYVCNALIGVKIAVLLQEC